MATMTPRDGHRYSAVQDMLDVSTLYSVIPDPSWEQTDPAGHRHAHGSDTWRWVVVEEWIDPDGEEHTETGAQCSTCGATLEPKFQPDPMNGFRRQVPGLIRYYRDDVEISPGEFEVAVNGPAWPPRGAEA